MIKNVETRRAGGQRRVSGNVLARNSSIDTVSAPQLQASFIASRFGLGNALAAVVAEHAFQNGGSA